MHWVYTVLLIAVSAATVGFGGFLLRRLFTLDAVDEQAVTGPAGITTHLPAARPAEEHLA